ncbi:MAG: chemotaxis protein CheD [Pseudomonadota bacterium]
MTLREGWEAFETIHLTQGEIKVSDDAGAMMTTLVGSCVSACLFDADAGMGGMNHFLLPEDPNGDGQSALYGINQMELLINSLVRMGARKSSLRAKLFGGNRMREGLGGVGARNAALAETFLHDEGIPCLSKALRGNRAQRIQFHPASGRARSKYISDAPVRSRRPAPVAGPGEVELF